MHAVVSVGKPEKQVLENGMCFRFPHTLLFPKKYTYFAVLIQKDGGIGPCEVLATGFGLIIGKYGANFHANLYPLVLDCER